MLKRCGPSVLLGTAQVMSKQPQHVPSREGFVSQHSLKLMSSFLVHPNLWEVPEPNQDTSETRSQQVFFFVLNKVSVCSLGCPEAHSVKQAVLELCRSGWP